MNLKQERRHNVLRATLNGILVNTILAIIKGTAGIIGNSYALIADAIESASDVLSSFIVYAGLHLSHLPADDNHPYGHGKFEPLASACVAIILLLAAILICIESIHEIRTPHHSPAPFTLAILVFVVIIKEILSRRTLAVAAANQSLAVRADGWHHRSDAISSAAAFVGISISLIGGDGYECADDIAALIAAGVIAINAALLLKPALFELLDTSPDPALVAKVRAIAHLVPGVLGTHKCHIRKLGIDHFVDLDILCDPTLSIREGHTIAHLVGDALHEELPLITRILVHVEPADDYGR
jgi:cation diffusion facilitator family transporter